VYEVLSDLNGCVLLSDKVTMLVQNTKLEKVAGDGFVNKRVGASVIQVCRTHLDRRRAAIQGHDK
jgi:hypothetical protein